MPSLVITTRQTESGPRYAVRYRLGGRAYPVVHGGTFKTMKDAKARRDLIGGELAAGRNPANVLQPTAQTQRRTFAEWATLYRASRIDIAAATSRALGSHLEAMAMFASRDPATITVADVQVWVAVSR